LIRWPRRLSANSSKFHYNFNILAYVIGPISKTMLKEHNEEQRYNIDKNFMCSECCVCMYACISLGVSSLITSRYLSLVDVLQIGDIYMTNIYVEREPLLLDRVTNF
jgi:hypothetical protein